MYELIVLLNRNVYIRKKKNVVADIILILQAMFLPLPNTNLTTP